MRRFSVIKRLVFDTNGRKWLISTAVCRRVRGGKCLILQRGAAGRIWLIYSIVFFLATVEVFVRRDFFNG